MARSKRVKGGDDFSALLNNLAGDQAVVVMKAAVYAGIGALADALKSEVGALPVQSGYMPKNKKTGEIKKRNVVGTNDIEALKNGIGISRIQSDKDKADAVVSFNGYNGRPTKKYPKGVPLELIARSIESGSSVRQKNPFVRRTFNKSKTSSEQKAIDAGQKKLDEIIKKRR